MTIHVPLSALKLEYATGTMTWINFEISTAVQYTVEYTYGSAYSKLVYMAPLL